MYGQQNLPNLPPLMPIGTLGSAPFNQQPTSFGSVSSLVQSMTPYLPTSPGSSGPTLTPQNTTPTSSVVASHFNGKAPLGPEFGMVMGSPENGSSSSSSSVSPNLEVSILDNASTSSSSSTEATAGSSSQKNESAKSKDRKRKGL